MKTQISSSPISGIFRKIVDPHQVPAKIFLAILANLLLIVLCSACGTNSNLDETQQALLSMVDEANSYETWYEVASSPNAEEYVLSRVAIKCAEIATKEGDSNVRRESKSHWATEIANALSSNPNSTDIVMNNLANSSYLRVWEYVAKSNVSSSSTLEVVAQNIAETEMLSWDITENQRRKTNATRLSILVDVAEGIRNNPNNTSTVMDRLADSEYYCILKVAAESEKTSTSTLKKIALKVATKEAYSWAVTEAIRKQLNNELAETLSNVAEKICTNPNADDSTTLVLLGSSFYKVWATAAKYSSANSKTLLKVAEKCVAIDNSCLWADIITASICNNPNIADNLEALAKLSGSSYPSVRHSAENTIKKIGILG